MQEEHTQESSTPEVVSHSVPTVVTAKPVWKELLVPGSIIIAGVCIGLGLYFNGSAGTTNDANFNLGGAVQQQPNVPTDPGVLIPQLVERAGVDRDDFVACFDSERTAAAVQEDVDNALATGGRGTPWSVVIGPDGSTFPLNGALPAAAIEQVIDLARNGGEADAGDTGNVTPVNDSDHIKGSIDAPVVIVEFSDYDCPFCGRFHDSMNTVIQNNDDVAWVYRHFPLDQLHPQARAVAQAAECVAELGGNEAFWTFTDGYFAAK